MDDSPWPGWAQKIKQSYLSGGKSLFILHGNVSDIIGSPADDSYRAEPLADFFSRRLFGHYDLVLHYDVGRGLRLHVAGDPARLTRMKALLERFQNDAVDMPRDPTQCLRFIDRLVTLLLVGEGNRFLKTAVLFDYADLICSVDQRGGEHLATFLNWARSPVIRRVNLVFILMTESLSRIHPILVQSGHTEEIFVPLPGLADRREFVRHQFADYREDAERLATMSSGLTLTNLDHMMRLLKQSVHSATLHETKTATETAQKKQENIVRTDTDGAPPIDSHTATASQQASVMMAETYARLSTVKKDLMEAQCPGLIDFVEPEYDLDMVAGHTAAKERLTNDARLVREGRLDAVPMGYLLCGPVGVGKTFLAMCYAGTVGIPCLTIRNFRSKYVGESEANLERILSVVRELGPVAVIVDEADAMLGNRGAGGDSGTSARAFGQLASQMGDTRYRGKIIWFLLTCRPDLLPVDLKRQGRCEEHIPLFYPQTPDELREMFAAMARKAGIQLDASAVPDMTSVGDLSGADIESVLMRAKRESILRSQLIDRCLVEEVLRHFHSARGPAHEMQQLAAVLECSDLRYLPETLRKPFEQPGSFEAMAQRFRELEALESQNR